MGNPFAPRTKATQDHTESKETQKAAEEQSEDLKAENTPVPEDKAEETQKPALEVPETNMEGILDWVGEDKDRAAAAIEKEKAQPKPRKTLLSKLEDI